MITIRNLKKKYGKFAVLDGLDLDILENETLVLLGRSGVGKSVLLKHIIGITKPDTGTIHIDGVCISELSGPELYTSIRNMGMLFQGGALFDSMNVKENVGFYLREHGDHVTGKKCSKTEIKEKVAHALEMVGLEGTEHLMPSDLSGGMRKRAALARLIVYRPKVFLYDEPTTGLDPLTAMQINELIVKTGEELKATSIVVTHDILSAHYVADRMALIKEGKIAHLEKPNDFMKIQDPFIDFFKRVV
ncbi:MAG TPA: ATP-binding cassette domain-containing protein, partial [Rhabdochlamydiaceae bacterium]|nr:ATP-binding cassette domain-containing protein [Rhabdochlamydiaceae bacterium]